MSFSPKSKVYIAGHGGLLGSAVHRKLVASGFSNFVLRTSRELDLTDTTATFNFLAQEKPEYVFLCAAKVGGIQANLDAPAEFLYQNLAIQNNVIEGSRQAGVTKLLFVGSSCIYPNPPRCPITEDQLLQGPFEFSNEGYAIAKTAGIRLCQFYRKQYGCDFISAIPTNLFGVNDHYDLKKSHLLPALIRKIHTAKVEGRSEIEVWGTGQPRREFMLSDDCADGLVFLMQNYSGPEFFNVGTGVDHSIVELVEKVAQVLKHPVKIRLDPTKPDGMMRKVLDVSKLEAMGWKSKVSLEEAIRVAYEDFLKRVA